MTAVVFALPPSLIKGKYPKMRTSHWYISTKTTFVEIIFVNPLDNQKRQL